MYKAGAVKNRREKMTVEQKFCLVGIGVFDNLEGIIVGLDCITRIAVVLRHTNNLFVITEERVVVVHVPWSRRNWRSHSGRQEVGLDFDFVIRRGSGGRLFVLRSSGVVHTRHIRWDDKRRRLEVVLLGVRLHNVDPAGCDIISIV
jgi:hypothetical protein